MRLSFSERAKAHPHPLAQKLFNLMEAKRSNLCLSLDVTQAHQLLALADSLGPFMCVLKTHIDILEDFNYSVAERLLALSQKHQFLIFEDRKFADIGNTVSLQYAKGIYRMVEWADMVNAHSIPGPGIIEGLKKMGLPKNRALLLLAEMSSKQHLMDKDYQTKTLHMAEAHKDFVIGFIAQHRLPSAHDFIILTPGVNLESTGDALGQQYITPQQAIENDSDIIIVGRGIYAAKDSALEAQRYQTLGWQAYLNHCKNPL